MIKKYLFIIIALSTDVASFAQQPLKLWYDKPAQVWEETLPLGNGRLGMMPDGGITTEKVVLNDITLWSGSPQDANNYNAYKKLPEIRQLLLAGKNNEAQALIDKDFICVGKGSGGVPFGCYQLLGDLQLKYAYKDAGREVKYEDYHRELSLNKAIASCSYKVNGVTYKREYFTSFGDDVGVIRLTADKPGQLNFTVSLSRPERGTTSIVGDELQLAGQLDNGTNGKGMQYIAKVKAQLTGGTQSTAEGTLVIKDATSATIFISAGTDFKEWDYLSNVNNSLTAAIKKSYDLQKQQHIANFQKLFNRVTVNLGDTNPLSEPTDKRLVSFHNNPDADKGLPVLFYQFGRYLSICSTRVGLLPPNLQGLWANQVHTPWNGDYHLDVNVQMNHWPLEVSNLSELNLPLVNLVEGMIKHGEKTARAYYNADGWIAHVITNVWGYTEPGESASWGITKAGAGWLCDNLWEHYAFTNDRDYLKRIYPILKGSAQFYNSILIKDPKTGYQVTAPSSSPENSFYLPNGKTASICMGATIDNQIIRELFNNVITASKVLGVDADFSNKLQAKLKDLPPPGRISKDGRIMEWLEDYKETELHHRHISHLYGLYPASLITTNGTPELAEAAKKTLNVRGDDGPSWSIAYKLLFWARLHDGNRAYKLFREIMKPTLKTDINYGAGGGIYPNLLSAGPPFQIDGNFGTAAGIAEMLIQSNEGCIEFIPSIPDAWKATGEVKGLKARGGFTVDMKWKDGKITGYKVASASPRKVKIKINGDLKDIMSVKL
jgi:alpha-L-fucosidase 2